MAESITVVTIKEVPTTPFQDQKPGTSGLRKKVKVFQQPNYLENFIYATLETQKLEGATLVLGGDGRYHNDVAIQTIIAMCAAFGVSNVVLGQYGLFATPAVSATIRALKTTGGIILTASHNPGGPEDDFGVKYNIANGGPAPSSVTKAIFERSKTLTSYRIATLPKIDVNQCGTHNFKVNGKPFVVEVIDSTEIYTKLLKTIFDFKGIADFLKRKDFSMVASGLSGVGGPYARRILVDELGLNNDVLHKCDPLPDFGGGHPDPNLIYAKELVDICYKDDGPQFGVAFDGDADRNMILGHKFFVTPSDSVAIIAANAQQCIPYFSQGLKGVARSMPTSSALDHVAKKRNMMLFETPTGWKYFGNLLANDMCSICGEESFGTSSDHISEKDGPWAMLSWLSILAAKNKGSETLIPISAIVEEHWKEFGRNYYTRYDYEGVEKEGALKLMDHLRSLFTEQELLSSHGIKEANEFAYTDPTDKSVATGQGIRFIFTDGSRIIFRLSGTGSVGATIRMYIDKYETSEINLEVAKALESLVKIALELCQMKKFTGRDAPTVIT